MKKLAFCASVKHISKTDFHEDKISCAKDFISCHMQTLALKYRPEIIKKEISLIWRLRF